MDKGTEKTSAISAISITLLEATSVLSENLAASEPVLRVMAAESKLHGDQHALGLLSERAELQQKLRSQQNSEPSYESNIKRLRELQSEINVNETIQDYGLTQELAAAFLREVNLEISQLLGIDFASLTRRSGGCC